MHGCTYTFTCVYLCTLPLCVCTLPRACIFVHTHLNMCVHSLVCMCLYIPICVSVDILICMCVCVYSPECMCLWSVLVCLSTLTCVCLCILPCACAPSLVCVCLCTLTYAHVLICLYFAETCDESTVLAGSMSKTEPQATLMPLCPFPCLHSPPSTHWQRSKRSCPAGTQTR